MWKPIPKYEKLYQVSSAGLVRRINQKILKVQYDGHGYAQVSLCKNGIAKSYRIHVIVMIAFLGPCPIGQEINHKDGNKSNSQLDNLEYITHQQNMLHSKRVLKNKGGVLLGEKNPIHKLTATDIFAIRAEPVFRRYGHLTKLGKKFGVSPTLIYRIINRKTWRHC